MAGPERPRAETKHKEAQHITIKPRGSLCGGGMAKMLADKRSSLAVIVFPPEQALLLVYFTFARFYAT
jgi:hypothetical protein